MGFWYPEQMVSEILFRAIHTCLFFPGWEEKDEILLTLSLGQELGKLDVCKICIYLKIFKNCIYLKI